MNQNFGTICHTEVFSRLGAKLSGTIAKFQVRSLKIQHQLTSMTSKGLGENPKKMSWDNLVSPIDAKNSIRFIGLAWTSR